MKSRFGGPVLELGLMRPITLIEDQTVKNRLGSLRFHWLLILLILIAYTPFIGTRLIRTTGDEKVYIAQALEMASQGYWFTQILGGIPDYYKGPLHYLLVRFGLLIFGNSLWAALYMNLIFCLVGAVSIAEIVRQAFLRSSYLEKKNWSLWAGILFAFNVGVFGHFWASQMEVELTGIYALAFYFLWRGKNTQNDYPFWITAGIAGWAKSPLHSVLLGVSAALFWALTGALRYKWKKSSTYFAASTGILVCALGYAPVYFLDQEAFLNL